MRDKEAERALAELLLRGDLTEVPMEALVAAIRAAMLQRDERNEFIRRALAALNAQGMTFDEIAQQVGISRSKANRWARDHR